MQEKIQNLESDVREIKKRNLRVEADKAWETSRFRIVSITVIIYFVATLVLYFIGANNFFLNALVPTAGYFLSMQSLSAVKRWWIKKFFQRKEEGPTNQ